MNSIGADPSQSVRGSGGDPVSLSEVVVQSFHERSALADELVQELLLEPILDREPLPSHGHQAQLLDRRNTGTAHAEGSDHHHVNVVGGTPQRQFSLEAPAEPPVELLVNREGLVGHVLHDRLEAVACRHDLLDLADQQHQLLRFPGSRHGGLPLR